MGILAKLTGKKQLNEQSSDSTKSTALYRAVQIVPGIEGCCTEAKAAVTSRYLSHEVPRLPLESCDFNNCQCTYQLFDDRRADLRRASDTGFDMASSLRTAADLRSQASDRRKTS
jgi:hypothetical protein